MFEWETDPSLGLTLMGLSAVFWTICNVIIKIAKPSDTIAFTVWSSLFVPVPLLLMSVGYMAVSGQAMSSILSTLFELPVGKVGCLSGFRRLLPPCLVMPVGRG